jgi:hypothetical protein
MTNHSGGGTPRRTGVCIPIPGTDSARVIIIPQLASDNPLTGDEQLLLKLHDELTAARSALAEKERKPQFCKTCDKCNGTGRIEI